MNYFEPEPPSLTVWYDGLTLKHPLVNGGRPLRISQKFEMGQQQFDTWVETPDGLWDIHLEQHAELDQLVQGHIYPAADGQTNTKVDPITLTVVVRTHDMCHSLYGGGAYLGRHSVRPYNSPWGVTPIEYDMWAWEGPDRTTLNARIVGEPETIQHQLELNEARRMVLVGTAHPAVVTAYTLYLENKLTTARKALS